MNDNYSNLFDTAYNLHISGNFIDAKNIYEKLLSIKPDDINVLNLYAQLNFAIKNYELALNVFKKIYELSKLDEIQLNIAKVYMATGNNDLALDALNLIKKEDINSLKLLAAVYTKLSRNDDAINTYLKIINEKKSFNELLNLSILYYKQKKFDNSLKYALEAYEMNNNDIDINIHLASIYEQLSEWQNALERLIFVSEFKTDVNILKKIGVLYKRLNDDINAVDYFNKVLNIDSDNKDALLNIAHIYKNHDKNITVQILKQLFDANPTDDSLLFHIYIIYQNMMNNEECCKIAQKLIEIKPNEGLYYLALGDSLMELFRYNEALDAYKKSEALNNSNVYTRLQIAYIYSISGKVTEALDIISNYMNEDSAKIEYLHILCREKNLDKVRDYFYLFYSKIKNGEEIDQKARKFFYKLNIYDKYSMNEDFFALYRNQKNNSLEKRLSKYQKKDWRNEDIRGKKVLVYSSQGAGDLIMFSRYLKDLKSLSSSLIIQMSASLIDLYKYNFPDIKIYSNDENIDKSMYDYATSYMCILSGLNVDLHDIDGSAYLSVDKNMVKNKSELDIMKTNKKKVGLYWMGNPTSILNRSIKLEKFLPLFEINNIQMYSFQVSKVDIESETLKNKLPLVDLSPMIHNYCDTAAFLKNIDVLVTIDSSIAHLAGAMGIKTYLLLPYAAEWRWFYDTETTPWYNSVKIFKQKNPCDWDEVFLRVKNELTV